MSDNFSRVLHTYDKFQSDVFTKLKPINLVSCLGRFFTAPSMKEAVKCFIKLLELYDIFWGVTIKGSYAALKLIVLSIRQLTRTCRAFADWVVGLVPRLSDYFSKLWNEDDTAEEYMNKVLAEHGVKKKPNFDWRGTLFPLLIGVVAVLGGTLIGQDKTGEWLLRTVSLSGGAFCTLVKSFTSAKDLFYGFNDMIYQTLGYGVPSPHLKKEERVIDEENERESCIIKINALVDYMDKLALEMRSDPQAVIGSAQGPTRVKDALKTVDDLIKDVGSQRFLATQCRNNIDTLKHKKIQVQRAFEELLYSIRGKVQPSTLYLYGEPGVGKSRCVSALIDRLSFLENRQLTYYVRNPSLAYWDSYVGQDVVIYDDFGQDTENTDHSELIQIYTDASYILPMAAVESKGTHFTSTYLILCSNFPRVAKSKRVTDVSALDRRRDFFYHVEDDVHHEYVTRGIQMPKIIQRTHYRKDFSHLRFTPLNRLPDKDGLPTRIPEKENGSLYTISHEMYLMKLDRVKVFEETNIANLKAFMSGQPKLLDMVESPILGPEKIPPIKMPLDIVVSDILKRLESVPSEYTLSQFIQAVNATTLVTDAIADTGMSKREAQKKMMEISRDFSVGFKRHYFEQHLPGGPHHQPGETVRDVLLNFGQRETCFFCASFDASTEIKKCGNCLLPYCQKHSPTGEEAHLITEKTGYYGHKQSMCISPNRYPCCDWFFGLKAVGRLMKTHGCNDFDSIMDETEIIWHDGKQIGSITYDIGLDPMSDKFKVVHTEEMQQLLMSLPQAQKENPRPLLVNKCNCNDDEMCDICRTSDDETDNGDDEEEDQDDCSMIDLPLESQGITDYHKSDYFVFDCTTNDSTYYLYPEDEGYDTLKAIYDIRATSMSRSGVTLKIMCKTWTVKVVTEACTMIVIFDYDAHNKFVVKLRKPDFQSTVDKLKNQGDLPTENYCERFGIPSREADSFYCQCKVCRDRQYFAHQKAYAKQLLEIQDAERFLDILDRRKLTLHHAEGIYNIKENLYTVDFDAGYCFASLTDRPIIDYLTADFWNSFDDFVANLWNNGHDWFLSGEFSFLKQNSPEPGIEAYLVRDETLRTFTILRTTTSMKFLNQVNAIVPINRYPIYLFIGAPGTGKTQLLKAFEKDTRYRCIDEIPENADVLQFAVSETWKVYDNHFPDEQPYGLIMTANPTTLDKMMLQVYDKDKYKAFLRRCRIYDFSFKRRHWYSPFYYGPEDITPGNFNAIVKIVGRANGCTTEQIDLRLEIGKFNINVDKQVVFLDFDEIDTIDFVPDVHLKLPMTLDGCVKPKLSDFQFVRGLSHFSLFSKIFVAFSSRRWGSIDAALAGLATENVPAGGVYTLLFQLNDANFLVTTQENGPLKVQKLKDRPDTEEIERLALLTAWAQIADFMQLLLNLGKTATGVWIMYDDIKRDVVAAANAEKLKLIGEGDWSDDPLPDDYATFEPEECYRMVPVIQKQQRLIPKSAVTKKTKMMVDSDPSLSRANDRDQVTSEGRAHPAFLANYDTQILGPRTSRDDIVKHLNANIEETQSLEMRTRRIKDLVITPLQTGHIDESGSVAENASRPMIMPVKKVVIKDGKQQVVDKKIDGKIVQLFSEAITDKQSLDVSQLCVDNTVYALSSTGAMRCRALMVSGRLGVTVAHLTEREEFIVECANGTRYAAQVIEVNKQRDLLFFKLEPKAREFKDISNHFITKQDNKSYLGYKGFLNVTTFRPTSVVVYQRPVDIGVNAEFDVEDSKRHGLSYTGRMDSFCVKSSVTVAGDCGSPLILLDASSKHKIIGIHSAGNVQTSVAAIPYYDDFVKHLPLKSQCAPAYDFRCNQILRELSPRTYCGFPVYGQTVIDDKLITQNVPSTTELYTSPFYEMTPKNFEPCILSKKDPRNPGHDFAHTGPQKWNHDQPDVDMLILREVTEEWAEYFSNHFAQKNYLNRVLTIRESINGVSYIEGSNPIFRGSSSGYPYKHIPGVIKKDTFLIQDKETLLWDINKHNEQGRMLQDAVSTIIGNAYLGLRPACAFVCSLKDEPRKRKKIYGDSPATRTFAAAPLDYTIAQRCFFHTAAACFTSEHTELPVKIGIDSKSLEWQDLFYYHAQVSNIGFDMDFKDWDATVPKIFMEMLPTIYNRIYQKTDPYYSKSHDIARTALHCVVHGPLLIIDDTVVQAPGGQVSGQPLTALDNCLVNLLYSAYIYMRLAPKEKRNFSDYLRYVRVSVYGDDNMTTVHPDIIDWFNFDTYREECVKLGLDVTPADKTDNYLPYKSLWDLSFLKQNFVKLGPYILGKPEKSSIEKMLSFTRGTRNHDWWKEQDAIYFDPEIIGLVIDEALHFSVPHGFAYYSKMRSELQRICVKYKIQHPHFPSFAEIYRKFVGD